MKNLFLTLIAIALSACGDSPSESRSFAEGPPVLSVPAQLTSDKLAIDLFRELIREQKGNILFSPACVEGMLRLLQQGARGTTAQEIANLPMGKSGIPTAMQPVTANALFIGEGLRLKPGIRTDAIIPCPLTTHPHAAAEQINEWVCDNTKGMIPDILSAEALQQSEHPVRLVAADAIALEEKWLRPFLAENTSPAPFHCADSTTKMVPMMHKTSEFHYAEGKDWRAVALFYRTDGREGAPGCFLAILPKGTAREFAATLTAEKFSTIRKALATSQPVKVRILLPKFELRTSTFSLTKALQAGGLRSIFSPAADLSGFTDEPLYLSEVLQRCYVKADKQGVKAAAVTAGVIPQKCMPEEPETLILNRPFVWAICDLTSPAAPYFLGLFENP